MFVVVVFATMSDEEVKTRNIRLKQRATAKRDVAAGHIRRLHTSATTAGKNQAAMDLVLTAVQDLNNWWSQYSVESDALLNVMVDLDEIDQFSPENDTAIYALVVEIKTIVNNYEQGTLQSSKDSQPVTQISDVVMPNTTEDHQSVTPTSNSAMLPKAATVMETQPLSRVSDSPSSDVSFLSQVSMRLPEIPLSKFDGDLRSWPDFRDRFLDLVMRNKNIDSDSTRFYYLLGCLQADSGEVLKGIPVTKNTFQLAWNTLVKFYDKPRKLASSIIEGFLVAPVSTSESLVDLKRFLSVFDEGLAILESLHLLNLCSFLLFTIAAKTLPTHTQRFFESENSAEYPSVDSVLEFVKNRVRVLENAGGTSSTGKSFGGNNKKASSTQAKHYNRPSTSQTALISSAKIQKPKSTSSEKCRCCGGAHALQDCAKFLGASTDERYQIVCFHRQCLVCLESGHMSYKCKSSCSVCKRRHHLLLHKEPSTSDPSSKVSKVSMFASQRSQLPSVVLATALLHVKDLVGSLQTVRVLIDGGSQISAISASFCHRLGLRASKWTLPVTGLSELTVPSVFCIVDLHIQPRGSIQPSMSVRAWVLSSITSDMPTSKLPSAVREKCGDLSLADPLFDVPAPVEILLGADIYPMVWSHETVSLGQGHPTAFNSIFGWAIVGPLQHINAPNPRALPVQISSSIESLMEKFWSVEEPEAAPPVFTQEGHCEEIFCSEMCKIGKGQYMVPLPLRDGHPVAFPGMRQIAVNRLLQL